MKIHHTGFQVDDLGQAITKYTKLGFTFIKQMDKPEPKGQFAHMADENGNIIELWHFEEDHPQCQYIARHTGFMCEDVRATAEQLADQGYEVVIPFTSGVTADYLFVQNQHGNTYELLQKKPD